MSRKPRPLAPGTARWVRRIRTVCSGLLTINGAMYEVMPLAGVGGQPVGYLLFKLDGGGKRYAVGVAEEPWSCDCGDFVHRREGRDPAGCKHVRALRALLAS